MTIEEFDILTITEKNKFIEDQQSVNDYFNDMEDYENVMREYYDDWIADMYISEMKDCQYC